MRGTWARMRSARGFTLIELLAVMAIIAILAAIVAPAVSGTKDSGVEAQVSQDALQVRNAANQYFSDQDAVEVVTKDPVTTLAVKVPATSAEGETLSDGTATTANVNATQETSSRWPELFITSSATSTDSIYYAEFPVTSNGNINTVYVVDFGDKVISGKTLLEDYAAVNFSTLVSKDYLEAQPQGVDSIRQLDSSTTVHSLLWLLIKVNSPGSDDAAGREVRVFRLAQVKKVEIANGTLPPLTKFDLFYQRGF